MLHGICWNDEEMTLDDFRTRTAGILEPSNEPSTKLRIAITGPLIKFV